MLQACVLVCVNIVVLFFHLTESLEEALYRGEYLHGTQRNGTPFGDGRRKEAQLQLLPVQLAFGKWFNTQLCCKILNELGPNPESVSVGSTSVLLGQLSHRVL